MLNHVSVIISPSQKAALPADDDALAGRMKVLERDIRDNRGAVDRLQREGADLEAQYQEKYAQRCETSPKRSTPPDPGFIQKKGFGEIALPTHHPGS